MLKWQKDGDQHVALGNNGQFRITVWFLNDGPSFNLDVKTPGFDRKVLGNHRTLAEAKYAAAQYDCERDRAKKAS